MTLDSAVHCILLGYLCSECQGLEDTMSAAVYTIYSNNDQAFRIEGSIIVCVDRDNCAIKYCVTAMPEYQVILHKKCTIYDMEFHSHSSMERD